MSIRLNKVIRELNVGIDTIVDYLKETGVEIKSNPNEKITEEQYEALRTKFGADKTLRKEADKLLMEQKDRKEKEKKPAPAPRKQQVIKTEIPADLRPGFKTVGRIDLDATSAAPRKEVKSPAAAPATAAAPAAPAKSAVSSPAAPAPQPEAAPKAAEKPAAEAKPAAPAAPEVKSEAKAETKAETKAEPKAETAVETKAAPKAEPKAEAAAPALAKESAAPKAAAPKPAAPAAPAQPAPLSKEEEARRRKEEKIKKEEERLGAKEEDGIFRLHADVEIAKPKVLGTIDLSAINSSTRPRKKTKEEKRRERAGAQDNNQNAAAGREHRKRNRIGQERVDVNAVGQQINNSSNNNRGRNNNQQNARNADHKNRGKQRKLTPLKPDVSDEEVAKQVRETLARLTNTSKGGKGAKYRREKRENAREQAQQAATAEAKESKILKLTEFVTVAELAAMMNVPVTQIIATCMSIGLMVSINQRLDAETIDLVAEEFGFKTEYVSAEVSEAVAEEADNEEDLEPRAPIVTVMGHVDHGKTSLLDYIRKSNVIAGEAGGITQHIGAYNVTLDNGRHITFLDTPGHEAFTAMRARGAQVTDVAIIIIAADDGIMPQTKEAISHAQAANVPIVFAINKIDKPGANPEKIKEGLANMNFLVEDWGGKYQSQDISAKKGTGVKELLDKVLLEADMLDLKANPNRKATGTVIESSLDRGRGYVATVLVSNGTLKVGDIVLAGTNYGRVKALFNERDQRIDSVGPSGAATLLGLNGAPQAGDAFHVMDSEQEVRDIASKREQLQREQALRAHSVLSLDEIGRRIARGGVKELNIVVKGDVDGSVEALSDSLEKLSTDKVKVNVILKSIGQISENDVALAAASQAIIIGFQVRPSSIAKKQAEQQGVDIRLYSIIYDAIEEVKAAMEGLLEPVVKEEVTATIEVRQVFHISKVGFVAGGFVTEGKVTRSDKARLIRDGIVIQTTSIAALKRFKDDVREVAANFECGISLNNCNDLKEGDIIETFKQVEVKATL